MASEYRTAADVNTPDVPERTRKELISALRTALSSHGPIFREGDDLSHDRTESVLSALGQNPEYRLYIAQQPGGESALLRLQDYATEILDNITSISTQTPVSNTDLQQLIDQLDQIKSEAEKLDPDVRKIDTILTHFIEGRLRHFILTLDNRINVATEKIHRMWEGNQDEATKKGFPDARARAERIRSQLPNLNRFSQQMSEIIEDPNIQYKAKFLADMGKNLSGYLQSLGLHQEHDPFVTDNLIESM